jgi:hypothetical protein
VGTPKGDRIAASTPLSSRASEIAAVAKSRDAATQGFAT